MRSNFFGLAPNRSRVMVFNEIPGTVPTDSIYAGTTLSELHPNIHVLRHPGLDIRALMWSRQLIDLFIHVLHHLRNDIPHARVLPLSEARPNPNTSLTRNPNPKVPS